MYERVEKPKENKSRAVSNFVSQKKSNGMQGFRFVDNRSEAVAQKKQQEMANGHSVQQQQQHPIQTNNRTTALKTVIQLQPSNFYRSYKLPMHEDKFDGFKGERSGFIAKPLNALKSNGIINSRKFIGGHLLKAEFGGEDVRDNVVPWTDSAESRFGHYEDTYKNRITQDYQNLLQHRPEALDDDKWEWSFHVAVQYKDRNESDFPIAHVHGYSPQEKKAIYDELSEIPVSVMVNPGNTSDFYSVEGTDISGDIGVKAKPQVGDVQDIISPQKEAPNLDLANIVEYYTGRFGNNLDLLISKGNSYIDEFKNEDWVDEFKDYWYRSVLACLDEVQRAIDDFPDEREEIRSPRQWLLTSPLYYTRRTELEAAWGISKSWDNMRRNVLENPVMIERKSLLGAKHKIDGLITKFLGYLKNTIFDFNENLNAL